MKAARARLLLVEDHPRIQKELAAVLGQQFDVVAVTATASEAVTWLQTNPQGWDLAVVDIFLKQGNGYEVLRQCATRQPHQAVVVLSNYTREPARSSALAQGAAAVFDKSMEMEEFLAYCTGRAAYQAADQATAALQKASTSAAQQVTACRQGGVVAAAKKNSHLAVAVSSPWKDVVGRLETGWSATRDSDRTLASSAAASIHRSVDACEPRGSGRRDKSS